MWIKGIQGRKKKIALKLHRRFAHPQRDKLIDLLKLSSITDEELRETIKNEI